MEQFILDIFIKLWGVIFFVVFGIILIDHCFGDR